MRDHAGVTTSDVDRSDPACRAWVDRAVATVEADAHRSADSGALQPGTAVAVRPAERPVLVVPADPQEGTEPRPLA